MSIPSSHEQKQPAGDCPDKSDSEDPIEQLHSLSLSQLPMYSGLPWMRGGRFCPPQSTPKSWMMDTGFSKAWLQSKPSVESALSPVPPTTILQNYASQQWYSRFKYPCGDLSNEASNIRAELETREIYEVSKHNEKNRIDIICPTAFAMEEEQEEVDAIEEDFDKSPNGYDNSTTEDITGEDVMDNCDTDDEFEIATGTTTSTHQLCFPPTINSIFPGIPPVLRFVRDHETVSPLSSTLTKKLIWRNSTLTPNVVKRALTRSNFRIVTNAKSNWIGCFGKHLSPTLFRRIKDFQKLNHFPGSFQVGRKDRLTTNIDQMRTRFGYSEYDFYPPTFILPREHMKLRTFAEQCSSSRLFRSLSKGGGAPRWIVKPPAGARGIGVYVVDKLKDLPKKRKSVAQLYISDPYLINGSKFDLRIYVYLTSVDPLQLYIHKNGLVRFASQKYSKSHRHVNNRFIHLTNYSVNKKNSEYKHANKVHEREAHKWPLNELWSFLKDRGHNTEKLWRAIKSLVFKTMASVVPKMASMVAHNVVRRECVHELFGFDILLDSRLTPWLLEVNISPRKALQHLHTSSYTDNQIKSEVVVDMLNLAGFRLPPPPPQQHQAAKRCSNNNAGRQLKRTASVASTRRSSTTPRSPKSPRAITCLTTPVHQAEQLRYNLTENERFKHRAFTVRAQPAATHGKILEGPTTDDVLMLANTLNEWYRASLTRFERIFPRSEVDSHSLLSYIDSLGVDGLSVSSGYIGSPRYYDLLLNQFLQKYRLSQSVDTNNTSKSPDTSDRRDGGLVLGGVPIAELENALQISREGILHVVDLAAHHLSVLTGSKRALEAQGPSPPSPPSSAHPHQQHWKQLSPLSARRSHSSESPFRCNATLPHLVERHSARLNRIGQGRSKLLPKVHQATTIDTTATRPMANAASVPYRIPSLEKKRPRRPPSKKNDEVGGNESPKTDSITPPSMERKKA